MEPKIKSISSGNNVNRRIAARRCQYLCILLLLLLLLLNTYRVVFVNEAITTSCQTGSILQLTMRVSA